MGPTIGSRPPRHAQHRRYRDPAAILIDQLKEIWIDSELEAIETANWVQKLMRKDFTVAISLSDSAVGDPGADRMHAHIARRQVAGIDRRIARREQREKGRLRPLQMEGHLGVAVGRDFAEIEELGLAEVETLLLLGSADQEIIGVSDIGGGPGFAVVPFDDVSQPEGQLGCRPRSTTSSSIPRSSHRLGVRLFAILPFLGRRGLTRSAVARHISPSRGTSHTPHR